MNLLAMAKIGQLHLQNGFASKDNQVLSAGWVAASVAVQWSEGGASPGPADTCGGETYYRRGYGYRWWAYTSSSQVDFCKTAEPHVPLCMSIHTHTYP